MRSNATFLKAFLTLWAIVALSSPSHAVNITFVWTSTSLSLSLRLNPTPSPFVTQTCISFRYPQILLTQVRLHSIHCVCYVSKGYEPKTQLASRAFVWTIRAKNSDCCLPFGAVLLRYHPANTDLYVTYLVSAGTLGPALSSGKVWS